MPKKNRNRLGIILALFLLVACSQAAPSMTGNPATPVSSAVPATQTLFPPTPAPSTTPTFTPTPVIESSLFDDLEINLINDPSLSKAEFNQEGWPASVSMPAEGIMFYAVQCGNMDSVKTGFFRPKDVKVSQIIISQSCSGKSALLLVSPPGMLYSTAWFGGGADILVEESSTKSGMNARYTAFDMKGFRLFVEYAVTIPP